MKLLEKTDRKTVLHSWAVGEVNSEFYTPVNDIEREMTIMGLSSDSESIKNAAVSAVLDVKDGLVSSISEYVNWYKAELEIGMCDLNLVYTLQLPVWENLTDSSFLITDAGDLIANGLRFNGKINNILSDIEAGSAELEGITLLAVDKIGPYVCVEGTSRLIAMSMNPSLAVNGKIKVNLGLY